ncbi:hypothetical protein Scep_016299 [Stephania cephalantha]|uniref:Uncharacterized protein n=1 Tax=Stephania cephalantha TaxID=152367 RepID=A0AAP0IMF1_9MAGN
MDQHQHHHQQPMLIQLVRRDLHQQPRLPHRPRGPRLARLPPRPLTSLSTLRVLSLKHNHLSGTLPTNLSSLISLNLLFLSHNSLSGPLPLSLPSRLYRLDVSFNNLSGHLPLSALNLLPHLLTLLLQSNLFTGQIYPLNLPNLQDFNISNNLVDGLIPKSLSNFPISSFTNNNNNNHHIILCGTPLPGCKQLIASNPSKNPTLSISSSSTSNPASAAPTRGKKMSSAAIMGIVAGDVVVVGLMLVLVFGYFYRQGKKGTVGKTVGRQLVESEKIVYSMRSNNEGGFQRGRWFFLRERSGLSWRIC